MAEAHDSWLSGLGIDVDKVLKSLGPPMPEAPQPMPFGLLTPEEVDAIADGRYEGPGGESQVGGDGSQSGKGRLLKTDDGHGGSTEYFSGEYDVKPDGSGSVKGAVAKKTSMDGAVVETTGEVELSKGKAAVTAKKTEVDVAKLAGDALPEGTVLKFDMGGGTASAENSIRDDGMSFGVQANAGEGSITAGTQNAKSDTDETTRFGLSEGAGGAGRVHWGDADKDGNAEYGIGADIGPVSFDIKTEDPLRTALKTLGNSAVPGLGTLAQLADQTGLLGKENLTKKAKEGASELADEAMEAGQELVDGASEAIDDATEAAGEAIDEATEAASEAVDAATEAAGEAIDAATEAAGEAVDAATEAAGEAVDAATEAAGEAVDAATEAAGEAVDAATEAAGEAVDAAP
ncbi:MAG: hypothetical protein JNN18_10985, partial [Rubrivivax sp.]|nr:hypothetical protein [Rubrivivax sp.]